MKIQHNYQFIWVFGLFTTIFLLMTTEPAFAHPGHGNHLLPNLTEQILTPQLTITGLTLAFTFGAVHGLTPGHGKTIATAYLIGSNSTPLQTLGLSIVTTLTHTLGIFLLGLSILLASHYLLPEQLYYIFSLLSGIAICIIGFWQLESYFNPQDREHEHHFHQSSIPQSLITLGVASGLIPCSEALILLLGAIALHRVIYGLELVAAFSLGLGLMLAIIGLIAVYCRQWLEYFPQFSNATRYFSLISAVTISIVGLILTTKALI
ncbi:MAG: sulfite exporter TauE/SafE family protein [Pleurocapsa sp. MO_192.B19]|nr:sulfite exporter TauE/SafE family protein [Pleurocapsa sp. MO_192.B19]